MKKLLLPIIIVGIAVLLVGFFSSRQRKEDSRYKGTPDKVTVANIGEFSLFNLIAKEKGYFADYGLDAQIDEYDSGATSIGALQSGKADIAVAADFVGVSNMFSNKDLRIIAEASHHDVFRVIAARDRGIGTPSDLKGKKIGVTRKTAGEFYLGRFLALNGLGLEDVNMVDLPPTGMIEQFENGQLDSMLIFDPHAYRIEEKLGNAVVSWSAQGDQKAIAVIYSTRQYAERHPEVVERYLRALVRAERHVAANGADARRFMAQSLGYDDAYVDHMWPKFAFTIELGQDLLLTMEAQARWKMDNGLVERAPLPNYLEYVYFDALERAKPAAVTVIH